MNIQRQGHDGEGGSGRSLMLAYPLRMLWFLWSPQQKMGPRKSKKRSKSSLDSEHPDATEAARTDRRRSKSRTTRSRSRSRSARPEGPTAVESPVNEHNTSDMGRERDAANNVKPSSLETEVSGDSGASVSKVPQSHTVRPSRKSSM